ncbi:SUMF1/EgtB/PvdO family nonheme iron enzyme [Coraliomargarita parva]|uniref:SUMF1/EgtB/PvdO family nonheme iron enzyme n=1 Tax=Coraliomargarita parva TaxID=3014050 RepID=UPI0022B470B6|nr:SUMF1/EgtB/PvdO family nonheme iron enzyme [Coraliomargarita parva]
MSRVQADTFVPTPGGANTFEIKFVDVRNPGNESNRNESNTLTGKGAVPYAYRMGVTEVTRAQFSAMLKVLGDPAISGNTPIDGYSGYWMMYYVNWLNSGCSTDPSSLLNGGVYNIVKFGGPVLPWNGADQFDNGDGTKNKWRHKDAKYFLPTVDEWVKAAMYDGRGYFVFPTSSNAKPLKDGDGDPSAVNSANYETTGTIDVGSFPNTKSPYGCLDMAGNAWEVLEMSQSATDAGTLFRAGGSYIHGGPWLNNVLAIEITSTDDEKGIGFRIAAR